MITIGLDPKAFLLTFNSTDPVQNVISKLDLFKPIRGKYLVWRKKSQGVAFSWYGVLG